MVKHLVVKEPHVFVDLEYIFNAIDNIVVDKRIKHKLVAAVKEGRKITILVEKPSNVS